MWIRSSPWKTKIKTERGRENDRVRVRERESEREWEKAWKLFLQETIARNNQPIRLRNFHERIHTSLYNTYAHAVSCRIAQTGVIQGDFSPRRNTPIVFPQTTCFEFNVFFPLNVTETGKKKTFLKTNQTVLFIIRHHHFCLYALRLIPRNYRRL